MSKFYRANTELKNYLTSGKGLTFHNREETSVNYFTDHNTGKQVRVNTSNNLISLLSPKGVVVESSSSFTNNQIDKFLD